VIEEEEPAMRVVILAAIVALAGCTNTIDRAATPQPGKALAFYSNNDAEYREAAQRAEEWCRETYDSSAQYMNRRDGTDGSIVTFGCATN
jgi:hypothetical protein